MPQILPGDEIIEGIIYCYSRQMELFNVIHTWDEYYVKSNGYNIEVVYIFFSGSKNMGKPHLMEIIYNAILETLPYHCKDPKNLDFFCLDLQEY